MRNLGLAGSVAALMLACAQPSLAQTPQSLIAACDAAAASAVDEDLPEGTSPVPFDAIDPNLAVETCTRAVAAAW